MNYSFTNRFKRSFKGYPEVIHRKFEKQLQYLLKNIKHSSLHAKKYNETSEIWQARVDRGVRFYFQIEDNTYILLDIQTHAK